MQITVRSSISSVHHHHRISFYEHYPRDKSTLSRRLEMENRYWGIKVSWTFPWFESLDQLGDCGWESEWGILSSPTTTAAVLLSTTLSLHLLQPSGKLRQKLYGCEARHCWEELSHPFFSRSRLFYTAWYMLIYLCFVSCGAQRTVSRLRQTYYWTVWAAGWGDHPPPTVPGIITSHC